MVEQDSSTREEAEERLKKHNTQVYTSRFSFLNVHKGIRPSSFTGLMGTAGSGKSTLTKSIISDCAQTEPVTVYLTEEEKSDYELQLHQIGAKMENIKYISESQLPFEGADNDGCISMLLETLFMSDSNVIFIDNVTTSKLYEKFGYNGQCKLIESLRSFTKESGKTVFYIAHTKKNADNNGAELFNGGHIRGTYQAYQQAEYFYSLQPISTTITRNGEKIEYMFPILQILKHRYHDISKRFYLLGYKDGQYKFDTEIDYEKIKDIWKKRNTLR